MSPDPQDRKIKVVKDGPYLVSGSIPLSIDIMIIGSDGIPERWEKGPTVATPKTYALCRCGASRNKPFCDGAHVGIGFDGTETAGSEPYLDQVERTAGPEMSLTWSSKLCALARFCHRAGDAWTLAEKSNDPASRETAVQEACDCPSGSLVAWDNRTGLKVEPDFEPSIGLIENPTAGVSGPIRVYGRIPIESADAVICEIRNRVTLCRCGATSYKPFCDGTHIVINFRSGE